MKIIRKNHQGFTLIELMLAISLFMILSSFTIINYRANEKVRLLKTQAQEIVSGLQKIQNMALTGETVDGEVPLSYQFIINDCLNSNDCSYKLQAVIPGNESIDISNSSLRSAIVEVGSGNDLVAKFYPPRGKIILIDSAQHELIDSSIEITNAGHDGYFCIKINAVSGRIDYISGKCNQ